MAVPHGSTRRGPTAGEAATRSLRILARRFDETLDAARRGDPEGVHEHRSAVRRLRSALSAFRDVYDPDAVDALRDLLRVWGAMLGPVRDHEVRARQLESLLAQVRREGGELAVVRDPPALRRAVDAEHAASAIAHEQVAGPEGRALLGWLRPELNAFVDAPPLGAAAGEPAETLRRGLLRAARRTVRRAKSYRRSLESRHAFRKRVRRLDDAVAALAESDEADGAHVGTGLVDEGLLELGRVAHRIQRRLGRHRDAVLLAERVREAREDAHDADEERAICDAAAEAAEARVADRAHALRRARKRLRAAVDAAR